MNARLAAAILGPVQKTRNAGTRERGRPAGRLLPGSDPAMFKLDHYQENSSLDFTSEIGHDVARS